MTANIVLRMMGVCVQKDDMNDILKELDQTDLLVLASPILLV